MTKAGKHKVGKHKKPISIRKGDKKVRNCLMCQDSFMSEWSGERVCRKMQIEKRVAQRFCLVV